jgi:hypothetical protein
MLVFINVTENEKCVNCYFDFESANSFSTPENSLKVLSLFFKYSSGNSLAGIILPNHRPLDLSDGDSFLDAGYC